MNILHLALAGVILTSSATAWAHPRRDSGAHPSIGRYKIISITAEPKARIRGDASKRGLSPLEFARWIKAHPRFSYRLQPSLLMASSPTRLLNRSAIYFKAADQDGDGRIPAVELADFIDPFEGRDSLSPSA